MHRYQCQIGGSLEEFNTYFEALSAEAKGVRILSYFHGSFLTSNWTQKYKEETKNLVRFIR